MERLLTIPGYVSSLKLKKLVGKGKKRKKKTSKDSTS